ncbi:MAG: hypothetical protein HQK81_07815 [Desulfovibrionaceae bacterium]|nr:hypothetical protein [Desulfovibrionaceae bacterium]MBF0513957.1 hypothetical protein [Desulfovibrionaceae bacterium]
MQSAVDAVFKLGLLVLLALFLYLYHELGDVGRYGYVRDGELEYVVDSKTGIVYQGGYSMNHLTGQEGKPKK